MTPAETGALIWLVILIVVIPLWMLPVIVAYRRQVANRGVIVLLTVLGPLVITWFIALAMALMDKPVPPNTGA